MIGVQLEFGGFIERIQRDYLLLFTLPFTLGFRFSWHDSLTEAEIVFDALVRQSKREGTQGVEIVDFKKHRVVKQYGKRISTLTLA
jgi:hypothetical protein